jgi:hypothetical protein
VAHAQLRKGNKMQKDTASNLNSDLDIDDFESLLSKDCFLVNPTTKEPTNSFITLASPEHPSRKKIDLAKTRQLRAVYAKTNKIPTIDPLDEIDDENDYLVAVTLGWNLKKGGKDLAFTADEARRVYLDPKAQWLRKQVLEALTKDDIFIQASVKA